MRPWLWLAVGIGFALGCGPGTSGKGGWECTGSGTMTAKIGPDTFTSSCLSATSGQGLVVLQGVDDTRGNNSNEVNISLTGTFAAPGTYPFKGNGDPDLSWGFNGKIGKFKFETGADAGAIVVTTLTATQIEGTFSASTETIQTSTPEAVVVTEGTFSGTFGTAP
jgi:hypothetical protein